MTVLTDCCNKGRDSIKKEKRIFKKKEGGNMKKLTFSTQLLLTNKLLGLISRWRIFAECRYFKPRKTKKKMLKEWKNDRTLL